MTMQVIFHQIWWDYGDKETATVASFIICRPLPIVDHLLSAEFTNVRGSGNQFTEYRAHAGK